MQPSAKQQFQGWVLGVLNCAHASTLLPLLPASIHASVIKHTDKQAAHTNLQRLCDCPASTRSRQFVLLKRLLKHCCLNSMEGVLKRGGC